MRRLYLAAGLLFVTLGAIGAVLPLLPTVPFLLLAVFCFARSNPEWERKILEHPTWGPQIRDWQERRIISRKAKLAALATLAAGVIVSWLTLGHPWAWISVGVMMLAGGWIATRHEGAAFSKAPITIRPARESDLVEASALCLRSKAHWGYDSAFIAACRDELTLTAADLASSRVELAFTGTDTVTAGVVQTCIEGEDAHLYKLFIEPNAIGSGIGRLLFDRAHAFAVESGAKRMHVTADPQAKGFYERVGFRLSGEEASGSIPGRVLPVLSMDLASDE